MVLSELWDRTLALHFCQGNDWMPVDVSASEVPSQQLVEPKHVPQVRFGMFHFSCKPLGDLQDLVYP